MQLNYKLIAITLLALLFSSQVYAQAPTPICTIIIDSSSGKSVSSCVPVSFTNPFPVTGAVSGGGGTQVQVISAATTNSTSVKASAGTLYDLTAFNTNATTAFLKFYNKVTAPTCNSDTVIGTYPLVQNIPLVMPSWIGKAFSLGIGLCITALIGATDNTAATTGIAVSLTYK